MRHLNLTTTTKLNSYIIQYHSRPLPFTYKKILHFESSQIISHQIFMLFKTNIYLKILYTPSFLYYK